MTAQTDYFDQFEPVDQQQPQQDYFSQFEPVEAIPEKPQTVAEHMRLYRQEHPETEEAQNLTETFQAAERAKGQLSGLTFGLTENLDSLKADPNEYGFTQGELEGSFLPISGLYGLFTKGAMKVAQKSPILVKQAQSLARILGAGAAGASYEGGKDIAQGKLPEADDLLAHGIEWAALDAGLSALGWTGRFASALLRRSKATGKPAYETLNELLNTMRSQGLEISADLRTAEKAMEILGQEAPEATGKLSVMKRNLSDAENIAQQELLKGQLAQQEVSVADLASRKAEPLTFQKLGQDHPALAEPIKPEELDVSQALEDIQRSEVDQRIKTLAQRAATERELGQSVQQDINQGLEAARGEYRPLYQQAEEAAQTIATTPQNTARIATEQLQNLERIRTRPTGYTNVIRSLESILEDVGFVIERNPEGKIVQVVGSTNGTSASDLMELGRRLNEIVEYDVLEAGIKNRLKPVVNAVKQDIRAALRQTPEALEAFNQAESLFARTAQRYGRDSIRKIRGEQALERVAQIIKSPTALQDLRAVLSPQQYAQVERELVEQLRKMKHPEAQKAFREIRQFLSPETQDIAREVVNSKLPLSGANKVKAVQKSVIEDLTNSINTGARPSKTLKLWQTPQGQKLVKEALKNNPNKAEILRYLEDQSFNDFVKTVVGPDGAIDFKKFNELLKNPGVKENLKLVGGDEAVLFFNNLERRATQLEKNLNLLEKLPSTKTKAARGEHLLEKTKAKAAELPKAQQAAETALERQNTMTKGSTGQKGKEKLQGVFKREHPNLSKLDDVLEMLGFKGQYLLKLLGIFGLGVPKGLIGIYGSRALYKLAKDRRVQKAFVRAAAQHKDPRAVILSLESLDKLLREDEGD